MVYMELHNPMMCHQSRLPLFTHVVRPVQHRLKRKANNPVCPALKSEKKLLANEVNKATLEVACNQNTPEVVNLQLQPIISDAKMMRDVEVSQPVEAVRQPVNFKFKNSYHVVKPNVFGNIRRDKKTPVINKTQLDRDITALLKRIRTQVENELLNKSATSSIQNIKKEVVKLDKPTFPQEQSKTANKPTVPEYESKAIRKLCSLAIAKEQSNSLTKKQNTIDTSLSNSENPELKNNEREITQSKQEDQITKPTDMGTERAEINKKRTRNLVNTMTPSLRKSTRQNNTRVDDTKVVFVGRLEPDITKQKLGNKFAKFGHVTKVRIHSKEDGTRYGFVTYERTRDAWSAVRAAGTFAQYDVRFGAHCAFFKKSTADLDGIEATRKVPSTG
ncbi:hypothetical protein PYW08_009837 [Mythimna loreyi]|uniref:Uncharacterized protein n=1 Tax=Mythimna loreyi TaxID=667449 RepID=A0ACC2Q883_9NEOP|nr:hypothetical protein PYW08_009837 [Mythimna loreyi]